MTRQLSLLSLASVLLAGCHYSAGVYGPRLETRYTCIASLNNKPHFSIVSDGKIFGAVRSKLFVGTKYSGNIKLAQNGRTVDFYTKGSTLVIGDETYRLSEGRLFAVAVNNDPILIEQFMVTEKDRIRSLLAADDRLVTFFGSK